MSMQQKSTTLDEILKKFRNGDLLLPDFQRGYEWNVKDDIKPFAASFLLKYPIGGFLIGVAGSQDFNAKLPECFDEEEYCKKLVPKSGYTGEEFCVEKVLSEGAERFEANYLFDGQQRLTSVEMIFGDGFEKSRLPKGKRPRWFINIEKLNFLKLEWPGDIEDWSFDSVAEDDIIIDLYIDLRSTKNAIHPSNNLSKEFFDFCVDPAKNKSGILYPLDKIFSSSASRVHTNIFSSRVDKLMILTDKYKKAEEKRSNDEIDDDKFNQIKNEIKDSITDWAYKFQENFIQDVKKYPIGYTEVPSNKLARVAGIFEVINKQGVKLEIFDLLLSRSIVKDKKTIRKEVEDALSTCQIALEDGGWLRYAKILPKDISDEYPWNPGSFFNATDRERSLPQPIKSPYAQVVSLLARIEETTDFAFSKKKLLEFTIESAHKILSASSDVWGFSEKTILKTPKNKVIEVQQAAIRQLVRAYVYMYCKYGIRKYSDITYKQMVLPLACAMTDDVWEDIVSSDSHWRSKKIDRWYWASIFGGAYKESQDRRVRLDIPRLLVYISKEDLLWPHKITATGKDDILEDVSGKDRFTSIFSVPGYSDLEALSNGESNKLESAILQFEIRNGIRDITHKNKDTKNYEYGTFLNVNTDNLQSDHIISVEYFSKQYGSEIKRTEQHKVNSPLNKTWISAGANNTWSESYVYDKFDLKSAIDDPTSNAGKAAKDHNIPCDALNAQFGKVYVEGASADAKKQNIEMLLDKLLDGRFKKIKEKVDESMQVD